MGKPFTSIAAAVLLLLATTAATAQTTASPVPYAGPRYPGGPDSLRALIYRSTRLTVPAAAGRMLLKVTLADNGHPQDFKLVQPAERVRPDLTTAAVAALDYLKTHMRDWQPGTPDPKERPEGTPVVNIVLDFTGESASQPLLYPDQDPAFPDFVALLHAQQNEFYERLLQSPARRARLESSRKGLVSFIQMQVKYPPAALRQRQQGTVYAYFEIAESGAIERPAILGTAGDALDAEVLRVLQALPAATASPLLQGRPVRVYYVVPVTFKTV